MNGAGIFTSTAIEVLRRSGYNLALGGLLRRMLEQLGEGRWQTPTLDGPAAMLRQTLVRRTPA